MTIDEIAYLILNTIRGGISTNNENLPIQMIKASIKTYRSLILRREFEKGNRLTDLAQEIPVNAVYSTNEHLTESIPELLRVKSGYGILKLTSPTGTSIPVVSMGKYDYHQYESFTKDKPIATMNGVKIKIKNATPLADTTFNVLGIFEDPEKAFDFNNNVSFWRDDRNEYLSDDLAQQVAQAIISAEGKYLASIRPNTSLNQFTQPLLTQNE